MYTLPETSMFAPYNGQLEDKFPFGVSQVQRLHWLPWGCLILDQNCDLFLKNMYIMETAIYYNRMYMYYLYQIVSYPFRLQTLVILEANMINGLQDLRTTTEAKNDSSQMLWKELLKT